MNLRRIVPALVLSFVALFTFLALRAEPQSGPEKFEAHEFALFRSTYESLRVQSAESRAAHFRSLTEATESATLTTGMTEALSEFCHTVLASADEAPEVKAEVKIVLNSLESRLARVDNTAGRKPASVGPSETHSKR